MTESSFPDRVFAAIEALTASNGVPPTLRELQDELGIHSMSMLQEALDQLKEAGRVSWQHNKPRTLVTTTAA